MAPLRGPEVFQIKARALAGFLSQQKKHPATAILFRTIRRIGLVRRSDLKVDQNETPVLEAPDTSVFLPALRVSSGSHRYEI
jgi:hypothetical protein